MTPKDLMRLELEAGFDVRPGRDGLWDIWATEHSFNRLAELLASAARQDVALGQSYLDGLEEGYSIKCERLRADVDRYKASAAMWRNKCYELGGTPLPWEPEELIQKAVEAEREACARVAGVALLGADKSLADRVVNAIRSRGYE